MISKKNLKLFSANTDNFHNHLIFALSTAAEN